MDADTLKKCHLIERYIHVRKNVSVKVRPILPKERGLFLKAYGVAKAWLTLNRRDML